MSYYKCPILGEELIDCLRETMPRMAFIGFCYANCRKYVTRAGNKPGESAEKDLKKALDYAVWWSKQSMIAITISTGLQAAYELLYGPNGIGVMSLTEAHREVLVRQLDAWYERELAQNGECLNKPLSLYNPQPQHKYSQTQNHNSLDDIAFLEMRIATEKSFLKETESKIQRVGLENSIRYMEKKLAKLKSPESSC